jgi:hypothetical protein
VLTLGGIRRQRNGERMPIPHAQHQVTTHIASALRRKSDFQETVNRGVSPRGAAANCHSTAGVTISISAAFRREKHPPVGAVHLEISMCRVYYQIMEDLSNVPPPSHEPARVLEGQTPAHGCLGPGQRIGFDPIDAAAFKLLPADAGEVAMFSTEELATAVGHEGARGPSVKRLLAREIASRRVRLRTYQGLSDTFVRRAARDPTDLKAAQVFSGIAAREQRALLAAIELLDRLEPHGASVAIQARNAAVWISRGGTP